jgi:asparagine synthase (glutamine-hydrolysing)
LKAITGIYNLNREPVDRLAIEDMIDNVANWPCQERELQSQGYVGFGLRRRYARQPTIEGKGTNAKNSNILITANARIDNRDELINKLSLSHFEGQHISDSDLIVASYKKWGEDCPMNLLGDFSFALWDSYNRKLFCVRDPMGVMPFYYYHSHNLFVFASSIAAIIKVPKVPKKINELRVAYYLARIYNDPIITMFKDIVRLPAGHCLSIENGRLRRWSYWELDPKREIKLGSDAEYEEAMREIFFLRRTLPLRQ